MIDIEKLRAKHAQELKYALLENEMEQKLTLSRFSVIGESMTQKNKIQCSIRGKELFSNVSKEGLQEVLRVFPITEKSRVYIGGGKYMELEYDVQLHRNPNDKDTILSIGWISGDLDISTDVEVGILEGMKEFFSDTTRIITESERSSFGLIRWTHNMLNNFRFKTFSCGEVVHFQGGYHRLKTESVIKDLVGTILSKVS